MNNQNSYLKNNKIKFENFIINIFSISLKPLIRGLLNVCVLCVYLCECFSFNIYCLKVI